MVGALRVIAISALRAFWEKHANAEGPLRESYAHVVRAQWRTTHDIKNDFRSADFVGSNRVVFDIAGNRFRLIAVVLLQSGFVYIRFVGTHAEYDKVNASEV
jgi:mRNA interferase HigB